MLQDAITSMVVGILGVFSPRRAYEYRMGRELLKRGYDASRVTGPNQRWLPSNTTADSELRSIPRVRARCRDLVRNNPWVAGALQTASTAIIGDGRIPQPMVLGADGKPDKDINDALLDAWWAWEEDMLANGGSFTDAAELAVKHQYQDGELLFRRVIDQTPSGIPLRYEAIECDQIDTSLATDPWYSGVKVNRFRRPVAYAICDRHPGDSTGSGEMREIPSGEILHVFRRDRVSQTRGCPWLAPAVWRLYDLDEYLEFEQLAAKASATFCGVLESDFQTLLGNNAGANSKDGSPQETMEPGRFLRLKPGEKFKLIEHNRPNSSLPAFVENLLRSAAAAVSMGYEAFANDYTKANYSNMRGSKVQERAVYKVIHFRNSRQMYVPMWRDFVKWATIAGKVKRLSYSAFQADPQKYTAVLFPPPVFPWVDPLKDIEAEVLAIDSRLQSWADYLKGQGKDPIDVFNTIADNLATMKALGIEPKKAEPPTAKPAKAMAKTQPEGDTQDEED